MENFCVASWLMDIFHEFYNFFIQFDDTKDLGVNITTFLFVMTLVLTTTTSIGLIKQRSKIIKEKSGENISFLFYSFLTFPAFAVAIYGYYKLSFALIVNGLAVGTFGTQMLVSLLKYQSYSRRDLIIGYSSLCSIPLILFIAVEMRDILFFVFGCTVLSILVKQVYLVWKSKKTGSLHIGPAVAGIFSSTFWISYATWMSIWPMQAFNALSLLTWSIFIILYLLYNKRETVA